jgi:CRP-like cAMP-binding protein
MSTHDEQLEQAIEEVVHVMEEACETLAPPALDTGAGPPSHVGLALVRRVGTLQERLAKAASRLRRTQARALREEGMTTDRIAELFGVSRQRVSALLKESRR